MISRRFGKTLSLVFLLQSDVVVVCDRGSRSKARSVLDLLDLSQAGVELTRIHEPMGSQPCGHPHARSEHSTQLRMLLA